MIASYRRKHLILWSLIPIAILIIGGYGVLNKPEFPLENSFGSVVFPEGELLSQGESEVCLAKVIKQEDDQLYLLLEIKQAIKSPSPSLFLKTGDDYELDHNVFVANVGAIGKYVFQVEVRNAAGLFFNCNVAEHSVEELKLN